MQLSDDISKWEDVCPFKLDPSVFAAIEADWGVKHTFDRFASGRNRQNKLRFCAIAWCDGVRDEDVDAFTTDWGGEHDNWIFPPFARVGEALRHMRTTAALGTIVVPHVVNALWWPMVAEGAGGIVRRDGVELRHALPKRSGLLLEGSTKPVRAKDMRHPLLVVRMDFRRQTPPITPDLLLRLEQAARERGRR